MTQLDGGVPWQRGSYESEPSVRITPRHDPYGLTVYESPAEYTETVDPYLGTLRTYIRSSTGDFYPHTSPGYAVSEPQSSVRSRELYLEPSVVSPPTANPPPYEPAYRRRAETFDPLDPAYDIFASTYKQAPSAARWSYDDLALSRSDPHAPESYDYAPTGPNVSSDFGQYASVQQTYAPPDASVQQAYAPADWASYVAEQTVSLPPVQSDTAVTTPSSVVQRSEAPPSSPTPYRGEIPSRNDASGSSDRPRDFGIDELPRPLRARSIDDRMTWLGSAAAGLALAFIVYDRLLPFEGVVGFVIVYQLFRFVLLGTVTALSHPQPVVVDRLATAAIRLGARLVFGALAWTIGFVVIRGWRTLHHVAFYTHTMAGILPQSSVNQGGVLHALVGSGIELTIATLITLPLGIMTAVYMTEVGGRLARIVRTVIEAMTSLPDLLAGLFIYTLLIIGLGFDRSGLAAALALAITMLPLVARSAEVALRVVPAGLRDAGVALGSTQWRTVLQVVLPTAAPGLATALIIAVARAVGETAPVLITSGASTFMNVNPVHNPMNSLPLFIYASLRSGEPNNIARGFGAAVLLLVVVVVFFVLIRLVASRSVKTR